MLTCREISPNIFLLTNCPIETKISQVKRTYNQWQKLWEKLLFGQFRISALFPLNNFEKQRAKLASSYVMGSQHCIGRREGFLNIIFKVPIIFCHWLSEIYKEKGKMRFYSCCCIALHFIMKIITENGAKKTHKMPQYRF